MYFAVISSPAPEGTCPGILLCIRQLMHRGPCDPAPVLCQLVCPTLSSPPCHRGDSYCARLQTAGAVHVGLISAGAHDTHGASSKHSDEPSVGFFNLECRQ